MDNEQIANEFVDYFQKIIDKIKKYNESNGSYPVIDFEFLELSGYDFNKILLFVSNMKHTKNNLFDPTLIFKDNPEMLLTYYLIEGKKVFLDGVDEDIYLYLNGGYSINLTIENRIKKLFQVVSANRDLKDKVIKNAISFFDEYYDFLLSRYSFSSARSECVNSIYNLLSSEDISFEDSRYLYENIVCKNDFFKAINYDELLLYKPDFIFLPGFIDNISKEGIYNFFEGLYEDSEEISDEEIHEKFKKIFDVNKDRPESIYHLLMLIREFDVKIDEEDFDYSLERVLCTYPEFKEAFEKFDNETLNEAKAICEGKDVEVLNAGDLSKNQFFKDNLDKVIRSYINNGAANKELSIAILMAFAEKLRDSKGLDFKVVINTENVEINTLGYYHDKDKVLYINPAYVGEGKLSFVNNISTIFHEVCHATQFQQLFESDDYSYANLTMITDYLNSKVIFSTYYKDNYRNIAYEINARSSQLFETLKFIEEFCPEMKDAFKDQFLYNMTDDKVRKNMFSYSTSLQVFLNSEEISGSIRKKAFEEVDDTDYREYCLEEIERYKKLFSKFPVLEYDEKEYRFKLKSEEELIRLREKYEKENDVVGRDLVDNVLYDIKLAKYLEGKEFTSIEDAVQKSREGLGVK